MKTINLFRIAIIISIAAFLYSCDKENTDLHNGNAALKFQGVYKPSLTKNAALNEVVIESFTINVSEIEFEFDDDDDNNNLTYSDIKLKGPFEIDLVKDGQARVVTLINDLNLPETGYDEIEFEFDKNENRNSEMYKKTVLIKGKINGTPFIFFTDEEFELEIEFEEPFDLSEMKDVIVMVSFDVQALFDPAQSRIDITAARDRNGNGIIEIYEDDPDGNENLADKIEDRLDDIIEAFEDDYDD